MNKEAIQIIKDYVEGRMDIAAFKQEFDNNKNLKKILNKRVKKYIAENYEQGTYDYLKKQLGDELTYWKTLFCKQYVYCLLKDWLDYFNYTYNPYTKYEDDYRFLVSIEPSWLEGVNDEGIIDKIIAEMPKELSKTKRIQWGKERIKEKFKCDKSYPRWIQGSEWPIVNGKPLVFSHQSKEQKDDERIYYYFYDPDTGKQTVVEQFY